MVRSIIILCILGVLVGLASWEQVWVGKIYRNLESDISSLRQTMTAQEKVDTPENKNLVTKMYNNWIRDERKLVMVARHADLMQVSNQLVYLRNFVNFDNKEEAFVGLNTVQYLIDTHQFNVSTNFKNVI